MLFSVGVGRNPPLRYQPSGSGKEVVLSPLAQSMSEVLPAHRLGYSRVSAVR